MVQKFRNNNNNNAWLLDHDWRMTFCRCRLLSLLFSIPRPPPPAPSYQFLDLQLCAYDSMIDSTHSIQSSMHSSFLHSFEFFRSWSWWLGSEVGIGIFVMTTTENTKQGKGGCWLDADVVPSVRWHTTSILSLLLLYESNRIQSNQIVTNTIC